ncbi:ATP-dependent RNA helicase RhlE [Verrucomicrobium sp. GAS474]|uniref:DEAD/DEAH box helicase n=1 Tax=Verrucomicrobium sp. GAS474 TaxID=1882831 RepID=UPI0008798B85|nr:DEAD/DEAH box helicase [Verrucomicrobium sp. GAS474]SDU25242.1 ATP-dependent RNA helicase RhlE [Verrucomicrobium sp. GAS474]
MSFQEFGLSEAIVHGVQCLGYVDPTPIQLRAIPAVLSGKDLIAAAQTGTGKTAAFGLPILSRLGDHQKGGPRVLVLEPTRELAAQVDEAFRDFIRYTNLKVTALFGGVGYGSQEEALASGVDIVVATPGRLLDHLEKGTLKLGGVRHLVLDEVDRMLDMGFIPDVRRIVGATPTSEEGRQSLLFTATMPPEIERLASFVLKEPEVIEIGGRRSPAETVSHYFYPVSVMQKHELLQALLEKTSYHSVIIFSRTKAGADVIAARLEESGHSVAVLHSDRSQGERTEALAGFKNGTFEVLVATDLAARGIDIQGVSHVINFDVPLHAEDYVHRIGRTGRADTTGDAFTLITAEEIKEVESIERFIGQKVERQKLEEFPYRYTALFSTTPATAKPRKKIGVRRKR